MILDLEQAESGAALSTDICIIGAGAAGIAIAREFIDTRYDVCLLESGGKSFETETQNLYVAKNVGVQRLPHDETRLRYFGGTTNHWSGHCSPFEEEDFKRRDWVPHSGWPLERAELMPFYSRAYRLCELDAKPFEADWPEVARRKIPGMNADTLRQYFLQYSSPTRFGPAYETDLQSARNIRVVLHANVTDIVANGDAKAIDRIKIRTLGGRSGEIRARQVVLCCGGIENARLLLLSNGIVKKGLGNQRDVVGRYFMDHPFGGVGLVQRLGNAPFENFFGSQDIDGRRFYFGLALTPAVQRRERVLGCGIQFWPNHEYRPDSLTDTEDQTKSAFDLAVFEFNRRWHNLKRKVWGPEPSEGSAFFDVMAVAEQAPNPESRISLDSGRDELGLNRARVDWRLTSIDRETRKSVVRAVAAEFGRLGLGQVRMSDWLRDGRGLSGNIEDYNHHMGTTRMSDDPKFGVVDRNCQVHDLANLYVAGSSVFPTSGFANPTLTIVALALRLSDHLKQTT